MTLRPGGGSDEDPPLSVAALWRDSVALVHRNAELIAILAGAFYFLPQLASTVLGPRLGARPDEPSLALLLAVALVGLLAQGSITLVALDDMTGKRRTVLEVLTHALRRLARLFLANLAAGVAIGLGLLALVLPGIWLLGRLAPVTPVVMSEEQDVIGALERSWALSEDRAWPAAVYMLLLVVLLLSVLFTVSLVSAALQAMATLAGGESIGRFLAGTALAAAASGVIAFLHVAQAVLYQHMLFDRRPRR